MNKRITGLTVLMLLLMAAGAWAAPSITITNTGLSPSTIYCGTEYTYTIEATSRDVAEGATLSFDATLSGVDLKNGAAIDHSTGVITLTPVNVGSVKINVAATVLSTDPAKKLASTKKTFTLSVVAYKPKTITIGDGTDPADMNLGFIKQPETGALTSADELATEIVFKSKATYPVTFEAKGLPPGIKAELTKPENNTAAGMTDGASGDVEVTLTGAPTRSGLYNNIVLNIKNSAGTTASSVYNMRVFDKAEITTKSLPNMTWGKNYSTKIAFTGGLTGYPVSFDPTVTTAADLAKLGLSFDYETGQIFTEDDPYSLNDTPATSNGMAFGTEKTKSMDLTFKVKSPAGTVADSEEYHLPITVVAVPPTILSKDEMVSLFENALATLDIKSGDNGGTIEGDIADVSATAANVFYAVGPGTLTWTVKNIPAGLKSADAGEHDLYGKGIKIDKGDDTAVKAVVRHPITVTVSNPSGSDSVTVYANLGKGFAFTEASATGVANIAGVHNISHDVDAEPIEAEGSSALPAKKTNRKLPTTKKAVEGIPLEAFPGPVTWVAKNLPSGLKLSIDKSAPFDTRVIISGDYKAATKKNQHFTITATNKVLGISQTLSGDVTVYVPPKITMASLPALTLGKNYSAKIAVNGIDVSVDVNFVASADGEAAAESAVTPDYAKKTYPATITTAGLTFDPDKLTITGSLDKWPDGESKNKHLKVTVTAKNPGYTEDAWDSDHNKAGKYTQKVLYMAIKAVPPKITTSRLADFDGTDTDGSKHQITITGSQPITLKAYVAKSAAGTLGFTSDGTSYDVAISGASSGGGDGTALPATKREGDTPTITGTSTIKGDTTTVNLIATANGYAVTGVPLTISADNGQGKPVVKVFKFAIKGLPPVLVSKDSASGFTSKDILSRDVVINAKAGEAFSVASIYISGDKPYTFQSSIGMNTPRNGITVTSADANGVAQLTIGGTPTAGKETKTQITITALNTSTKQKFTRKFTVIGAMKPEITTAAAKLKIETEVGKRIAFTPTARGTKPIVWSIDVDSPVKLSSDTEPDLRSIGLDFNENSGQITGTPHTPTSSDGKTYKPIEVHIRAINSAGQSNPATVVTIGVKGRKPKFTAQTLKYEIGSTPEEGDMLIKSDIPANDLRSYIQWALNSTTAPALKGKITVTTAEGDENRNYGLVGGTLDTATKGSTFKVSMDNVGNTVLGNVKIIITDPKPEVTADADPLEITANKTSAKTGKVTFSIKDENKTGDTVIKWAINTKPTGKVTAAIKPATNGKSATVTVTVPKGITSKDVPSSSTDGLIHSTFSVTATNTITKEVGDCAVEVIVTPYDGARTALPAQKDALPEEKSDEAETPAEEAEEAESDEEETAEGTVSYGAPRTAESLTAEETTAITEAGYIVAAILPEITADADGQYDLEAATLAENVPAGEALVWFAFPRNAEKSDDDNIAEFYDEAGAEITAVPETKTVIASPWLRKDVTYAPVIAVKAPVTSETKDSLYEATEGDTVTEQAIEEATETSADEVPAE